MSTNIKDAKQEGEYPQLEAGTYAAVCSGIIDLGNQNTEFEGKARETVQIMILWELPEETFELNGEQVRHRLSRTYTFSMSNKSSLRKMLTGWRGRDFTEEELNDFDLVKLLNAPCLLTLAKNDKGYTNIINVSKAMKGSKTPAADKIIHFDLDDERTYSDFPNVPKWAREKIDTGLTLKEKKIFINDDGTFGKYDDGLASPNKADTKGKFVEVDPGDYEDDLPF